MEKFELFIPSSLEKGDIYGSENTDIAIVSYTSSLPQHYVGNLVYIPLWSCRGQPKAGGEAQGSNRGSASIELGILRQGCLLTGPLRKNRHTGLEDPLEGL